MVAIQLSKTDIDRWTAGVAIGLPLVVSLELRRVIAGGRGFWPEDLYALVVISNMFLKNRGTTNYQKLAQSDLYRELMIGLIITYRRLG